MPGSFDCSVVTPQKSVLEHPIVYANVPAWDGQIGFMIGAAPVLIKLGFGHMRLDSNEGKSEHFFVGGGFCQMKGDGLSIITDEIIPTGELDAEKAQQEVDQLAQKRESEEFDPKQQKQAEARAKALLNTAVNH